MESIVYEHRKIFHLNTNAEKLLTQSRQILFCHFSTVFYNTPPKKWADVTQNVKTAAHPEMEGNQK